MRPFDRIEQLACVSTVAAFVAVIELTTGASRATAQIPPEVLAYADTIFTNGKVLTVDKDFSIREAVAIRDGRILATGPSAAIERMAGPNTQRIDLAGKTIIPGIIDTHAHFQLAAIQNHAKEIGAIEPRYRDFANVAKVQGSSVADLLQNIKAVAAARQPGTWINLQIASPELGPAFWDKIRRRDLDAVAPNNLLLVTVPLPLVPGTLINTKVVDAIKAFYGHMPTEYELDETGLLSGRVDVVLVESLIGDLLFDRPMESLYPAFKAEMQKWASYGVTTDSGRLIGLWFQPVYREMEFRHEMPIRLAYSALGMQVFPQAGDFYKRLGNVTDMGTDMLWMPGAGVVHIDFAPCSTIASSTELFDNCQISKPTDLKYKALFEAVKYGNRVVNTHVSGDRAADQLLDLIEAASKASGMTPEQIQSKGHSLDHCSLNPRPDQIDRGKKLGVIWACAAGTASMEWAAQLAGFFGIEYANKWVAPVGSIIRAGGRVAGHGEGVSGDSYFTNLEMLLTRKDSKGRVWGADQAIDRKDLLRMYTVWAADYVARPDRLGSLESGKFADLVVLDKDYMTIPIDQFDTLHAVLTMVGGKIVYRQDSPPATSPPARP